MSRTPQCFCPRIRFQFNTTYFKPFGIRVVDLETVELSTEEIESFRLRHISDLDQEEAGRKMGTSQSTYQRILTSASKKIADALVNGKAIKISRHK